MRKKYMLLTLLNFMFLSFSCYENDNPLDVTGTNFHPPQININESASSIKNNDTIHFDSVVIAIEGNHASSIFNFRIDDGEWWEQWESEGTFGFGGIPDGKHLLYIDSKYRGVDFIVSDTITFYVVTKGYKPEFEKRNDTTITLFEGNAIVLAAKAEGRSPLHYSWLKGNFILEGKNSDSLKIASFSANDTASYKCIVSNEYGKATSNTFVLRYRPFSGGIKGVVTDASGNKLKNAQITLYPSNNKKDTTDSTGSFAFTSLTENSYTLKISLPKYYDTTLSGITVSDTETVILPTVKLTMIDTTTYSIEYVGNGSDSGTVPVDTVKYKTGSKMAVAGSGSLSKAGFSFSKWNTEKDGNGNSVVPGDSFTVIGNVTFYAQWVVKQFTLSFNGNGNISGEAPELKKYDYHAIVTIPANGTLKKDGYTFTGWNSEQNGNGKAFSVADTFSMPASEMVLYAQWQALPTYHITYSNNGADSGTVPLDSNTYYKGKEVTVAGNPGKLSKINASFSGWNTKADGTGESYNAGSKFPMPDSAVTLYVKWTTDPTYSITYHSATSTGGNVPSVVNADTGTQVTIADSGTLYKAGYSFVGWNTKEDGSGKAYKTGDKVIISAVNIDLYAQWARAQFTITYHGNGNTGGQVPASMKDTAGTTITVADSGALYKTGYTFVKWNTKEDGSGHSYKIGDKVVLGSASIALYAQWTKVSYTITYNGNGNTGGEVPTTVKDTTGASLIVSDSGTLYKTGYTFVEWNTKGDGTGNTYKIGANFVIGAANIVLYAQWSKALFTITYHGNGNTSGYPPQPTNHYYGTNIEIKDKNTLQKVGHAFSGWNSKPEGNGIDYSTGDTFTITDKNTVFYARWQVNEYKVTFASQGGSIIPAIIVKFGNKVVPPQEPIKRSYTFAGWYKDSLYSVNWDFNKDTIAGDYILYAKWVIMDICGNYYTEVKIGNQTWLVENLKTIKYNDGSPIQKVTDKNEWKALAVPAYCWYGNDSVSYHQTYGILYNWYAVSPTNVKSIAPSGWHIPSEDEWAALETYCIANGYNWDGTTTGNKIAKALASKSLWAVSEDWGNIGRDLATNNKTGFSALPGGYRLNDGSFLNISTNGSWWTVTENESLYAWDRLLSSSYSGCNRLYDDKKCGLSVRCLRDW